MKTIDFDFDNVGGISSIYAFPPQDVQSVLLQPSKGTAKLTFNEDANIIQLPVYAPNSTSWSEDHTVGDAGDMYAVAISGFIPRHASSQLVNELSRGKWMVVHQDANGDIVLSGTTEVPLTFTSGKTTGTDGSTRNGTAFTFAANEPTPSILIDPTALSL